MLFRPQISILAAALLLALALTFTISPSPAAAHGHSDPAQSFPCYDFGPPLRCFLWHNPSWFGAPDVECEGAYQLRVQVTMCSDPLELGCEFPTATWATVRAADQFSSWSVPLTYDPVIQRWEGFIPGPDECISGPPPVSWLVQTDGSVNKVWIDPLCCDGGSPPPPCVIEQTIPAYSDCYTLSKRWWLTTQVCGTPSIPITVTGIKGGVPTLYQYTLTNSGLGFYEVWTECIIFDAVSQWRFNSADGLLKPSTQGAADLCCGSE